MKGGQAKTERLIPSLSRAETNHRHRQINKRARRAGKKEARDDRYDAR